MWRRVGGCSSDSVRRDGGGLLWGGKTSARCPTRMFPTHFVTSSFAPAEPTRPSGYSKSGTTRTVSRVRQARISASLAPMASTAPVSTLYRRGFKCCQCCQYCQFQFPIGNINLCQTTYAKVGIDGIHPIWYNFF